MTKTEHRRQATNYILADLSREFWPHVDLEDAMTTFETIRSGLRDTAISIGQQIERAKVDGAKMRQIYAMEQMHRNAWRQVYEFEAANR